ncbi:MAG: hypothetical protein HN348_29515 [Proteobacteria bacterium]|nr:hypothetical protein [Pseudomonadota bacterium]
MRDPPLFLVGAVTFLPYLFLLQVSWSLVLWALLRRRRLIPLSLSGVFGVALLNWGPAWFSRGEQADGESLTMMSWNVRRLWGGAASGDPGVCVIEVIKEVNPDVVTLLEITRNDLAILEPALGMSCVHGTYTKGGGDGHGGLASCVRGNRWKLAGGKAMRFVDNEDWYYVFSEVERSGKVLNVLAVHLYPYGSAIAGIRATEVVKAQGGQSAALLHRVARFKDPTVVSGDFNSTRDAALHASLRGHMVDVWEKAGRGFGGASRYLEWIPLRIDYIYVTEELAVAESRVPAVDCSDHRPVVVELILRE